jgi:HNH endonuclease
MAKNSEYNFAMKNDLPKRFRDKVMRGATRTECDLWIGAQTSTGYGLFRVEDTSVYAHRYAWENAHGAIPDGFNIRHTCGQPGCVKLAHLALDERGSVRRASTDGKRYQQALKALAMDYRKAAAFLDLTPRTARDYAATGAPKPIEMLFALMIAHDLDVADVNRIMKGRAK